MSLSYLNSIDNPSRSLNFRAEKSAVDTKPLGNLIPENSPLDTIIKHVDEEKEKKHNKAAITAGGVIIGVSLLVALFNPRYSGKLVERLKTMQQKTTLKMEQHKDSFIKSKFYGFMSKVYERLPRYFQSISNLNSVKDTYFKQLCTEEKSFSHIRNGHRSFWEKFDDGFRKIMKKPHIWITDVADSLAKFTVKRKYKLASDQMEKAEQLVKQYSDKLPAEQKLLLENKLKELAGYKEYFSENKLLERFSEQENLMQNINTDIRRHFRNYNLSLGNKYSTKEAKLDYFDKNMCFWADNILGPSKEIINQKGTSAVDKLVGHKQEEKGIYNEIIDILSPYLEAKDKTALSKSVNKVEKKLRNANKTECDKYFDKKRDLMLGSAPTDILTAIIGLTGCGIALTSADSKDDRVSKTLTGVIPTICGLMVNIGMTAMLISGTWSIITALLSSRILNRIGHFADETRLEIKGKEIKNA